MSLGLKTIIQGYYTAIRDSGTNHGIKSKGHLAGLILGDLYDIYISSKDRVLVSEIKFFLDISNPIKHIISILDNSGDQGTMSIEEAIINEHRIVNLEQTKKKAKVTLYSVVRNIIGEDVEHINKASFNKGQFLHLLKRELETAKLFENLGDSTNELMKHELYEDFLNELADEIITGEKDLSTIISNIFTKSHHHKHKKNSILEDELIMSKISEGILSKIKETLLEENQLLHEHLDHVGGSTFEQLQHLKGMTIGDIPIYRHQQEAIDMLSDYEESGDNNRKRNDYRDSRSTNEGRRIADTSKKHHSERNNRNRDSQHNGRLALFDGK